uniref:Variant surface glycoprotein 699 n=1 Tax=Trypanosoma brucei TaxID=5691 RepID=M4SX79_9TRYP|nr:variant surface glycoprotein 699 [Trypanosoma brucei]
MGSTSTSALATILAASLLSLSVGGQQDDAVFGTAGAAVDNICKEATLLTVIASKVRDAVDVRGAQADSVKADLHRYRLAANVQSLQEKRLYFTALELYASVQLQKAETQHKKAENAARRFVHQLHRTAGALLGASQVAATNFKQKTDAAPAFSANTATVQTEKTDAADWRCPVAKLTGNFETGKNLDFRSVQKLKLTDLRKLGELMGAPEVTVTGCGANSGACTATLNTLHGTQNQNNLILLGSSANNLAVQLTSLQRTKPEYTATTGTTVAASPQSPASCRQTTASDDDNLPTPEAVAHSLCLLNTELASPAQAKTINSGTELAADNDFVTILNSLLAAQGQKKDLTKSTDKDSLVSSIKNVYGDDAQKFNDRFRNTADKQTIIYNTGTNPETKTIGDLAGTPAAETALSYLIAKREKQILAKANDAKPTVPGEEEAKAKKCSTETDKDKCNDKDGCKYSDKKRNALQKRRRKWKMMPKPQTPQQAILLSLRKPLFCSRFCFFNFSPSIFLPC